MGELAELLHGQEGALLPRSASSTVYSNLLVVQSGAVLAFGFSVYNSNASAQFILVFDTGQVPPSGAVPAVVFTAPGASNLPVAWAPGGRAFRSGLVLANSSTGPTYTPGSADCWFDCQYL